MMVYKAPFAEEQLKQLFPSSEVIKSLPIPPENDEYFKLISKKVDQNLGGKAIQIDFLGYRENL